METKVRKLVGEILDPVAEKAHFNSNEIKEVKLKNDFLLKKIEELDRYMKVDLNLRGNLTDLKKRVHNMVLFELCFLMCV